MHNVDRGATPLPLLKGSFEYGPGDRGLVHSNNNDHGVSPSLVVSAAERKISSMQNFMVLTAKAGEEWSAVGPGSRDASTPTTPIPISWGTLSQAVGGLPVGRNPDSNPNMAGMHDPDATPDLTAARMRMVERDIANRGVIQADVLRSMRTVPRERFLPDELAAVAYDDHPLPIGSGQTISQPYIVALMAEAAEIGPQDRVLEVGAGSGYGAAVLSRIARAVWTIERHESLAEGAHWVLNDLGYDNVQVIWGDGTLGYPDAAPFDAIVVTAGGPRVPEALLEQLADHGRLVIPVGSDTHGQQLLRVRRDGDTFSEEDLGAVRFVPLVGAQGVADPDAKATEDGSERTDTRDG